MAFAIAVRSKNRKVGDAYVTHVAQSSCDKGCPWLRPVVRPDGTLGKPACYANNNPFGQGGVTERLNRAARRAHASRRRLADAEARAIDALLHPNGRPMRLRAVGDSATTGATRTAAGAAKRFLQRGGSAVWTYTHAWRHVPSSAWGVISKLASCETLQDAQRAEARGYAVAMVVEKHPVDGKAYRLPDGALGIPCPAQTRKGVTCVTCRLCFGAPALLRRRARILFAAHGAYRKVQAILRELIRLAA